VTSWETRSPHSLTPGGSGQRPGSLITLNLPDFDAQVRSSVYRHFVRTGESPSIRHTSDETGS
jgi:hypothetical protein